MGPNKGLGIACSHYVSGASKPVNWTGEPHATVNIKLDFDGCLTILTGAPEIGQGSSTILTQCVAEVLGIDMARIRIIAGDSAITPKDNGAYSSRVTYMVGNAAIDAALGRTHARFGGPSTRRRPRWHGPCSSPPRFPRSADNTCRRSYKCRCLGWVW